jgi:hypothetical protein
MFPMPALPAPFLEPRVVPFFVEQEALIASGGGS